MYKIVFVVILFISSMSVHSGYGQVKITEEPEVELMMRNFISKHRSTESIRGWRIQIITTDNRRKMEAARSKFYGMYPNVFVKWSHESPYYKVQVGAYENKLSLQGFLLDLKEDFPTAIPIRDDVKKSELISN